MSNDLGGLDRVAANERRFLAFARSHPAGALIVLECECTQVTCDQRIELTASEYQPIRSSAARYAICPHGTHVDDADRLIEQRSSHWVVEREATVEVLEFFGSAAADVTFEVAPPSHRTYLPPTLTQAPSDDEGPHRSAS